MAVTVPTRVCIAGDGLDWLGGYSFCAAIDLPTHIYDMDASIWPSYQYRSLTIDLEKFIHERCPHLRATPSRLAARCTAPSPGGLGTSSSICIGILSEILRRADEDPALAISLAYEFEFAITHGGGVDHLSIGLGGWIYTSGQDGALPIVIDHRDTKNGADWEVTLINSEIDKNCIEGVGRQRYKKLKYPEMMRQYAQDFSKISETAWAAFVAGDLGDLNDCIDHAHLLMRDRLNLSTPGIERLRDAATQATGHGFKITGSGRGGCLFTVHEQTERTNIRTSLIRSGLPSRSIYQCRIAQGISDAEG